MKRVFLLFSAVMLWAVPVQAGYDLPYVGEMQEYDAEYEDTFVHLARRFNLGFTEMRAANPYIDPWIPGEGTDLVLPTMHLLPDAPHEGVVINLADMRFYAFLNGDEAPFHTPIGVGREGLDTPTGVTTVVRKKDGPTWTPTPRMRKEDPTLKVSYGPGADNPMGTHALYLGWPTYAFHGTNKPFGIGRRVSSGCIRLYPEKIVEAFELVPVGTQVRVVNQPVKLAWIDDELYMEAHPTLEQSVAMEEKAQVPEKKLSNDEMKYLIKTAGAHQDRLRWPVIRTALKERSGIPVVIARRPGIDADEIELQNVNLEPPEEAQDLIEGYKPKQVKAVEVDEVIAVKPSGEEAKTEDVSDKAEAEDDESVAVNDRFQSFTLNN